MFPRVLPVGDLAATLELGDAIDPEIAARVAAVDRELAAAAIDGIREAVPTYRSLLVVYDRARLPFERLAERLLDLAKRAKPDATTGRRVEIPVVYDGEDLDKLSERLRLSKDEIVARHAAREYRVFMLGFSPGFAYMGEVDETLRVPRRKTPRTRVPAGSVAIAGAQTGVYPRALPGGWNLIGRTNAGLFDPHSTTPSLLSPGDLVRFVRTDRLPESDATPEALRRSGDALEFLDPGLFTTIQDGGRFGRRRLAVPWAGFADRSAAESANLAVGNQPASPVFELAGPGTRIVFRKPCVVALAGADVEAALIRGDMSGEPWTVRSGAGGFRVRAGNELRVGPFRTGSRAYIAVAGLDAPSLLGSSSVDEGAGLLRRVQSVDSFSTSGPVREPRESPRAPVGRNRLRVVPGPQSDHFTPETIDAFFAADWTVGVDSDRVGARLDGPRLSHSGATEIVTDGMVPGCIQIPPDGRPIAMLRDCPTTGGYPKIGAVVSADLDILAQARPGESRIAFDRVALEDL